MTCVSYFRSRFKGKPAVQLHVHKGSTLAFLTHTALRHIHKLKREPQHRDTDIHVYFMAGICDITYKDELPHRRDWDAYTKKHHYEETIFMESPHEASTRIKTQLLNAAHQISSAGATPCFCTIPPCSISTWNHERLKQRKTTHLIHFRHYDDMQVNLQKAILDINRYIITLNIAHNMITPKIAVNIVKKPGAKRSHRYFYERLADGVHPEPDTLQEWAQTLTETMELNRTSTPNTAPPHTEETQGTEEQGEQGHKQEPSSSSYSLNLSQEELDYWFTESDSQGE